MSRSTRLFEIIQILRSADRPVTAQSIADTLEIGKRTIYRDIAALQAMRLPIDGEAGIGYVLRPGLDLPPLMFTQDEVEAIVVGLSMLGRSGDHALERSARTVAAKIADVLPDTQTRTAHVHVSTWNRVPTSVIKPSEMRAHIREANVLRITYRDERDNISERRIRPLALIYYIDALVLGAWCELRQGFRHFRLDRIDDLSRTGEQFSEDAEQLLQDWEAAASLP